MTDDELPPGCLRDENGVAVDEYGEPLEPEAEDGSSEIGGAE